MNKKVNNKLAVLALLGLITFSNANQRIARNQPEDIFNLNEDRMIINTP